MKRCVECGEEKPLSEFSPHKSTADRLRSKCKPCRRLENNEANRLRAEEDDGYFYWKQLHYLYKIDRSRYEAMLAEQDGLCAICRQPEKVEAKPGAGPKRLAVDHDRNCCSGQRSCGRCVRGLLCYSCNIAIGHLKDDVQRITALLVYLRRSPLRLVEHHASDGHDADDPSAPEGGLDRLDSDQAEQRDCAA